MDEKQAILNTEAELEGAGFVRYRSGSVDIIGMYQKRYDDAVGKKYFINAILQRPIQHPVTGITLAFPYAFEIMLAQHGTGNPVKMDFFNGWRLADVEEYAEKIWNLGLWDYYEKWEEA